MHRHSLTEATFQNGLAEGFKLDVWQGFLASLSSLSTWEGEAMGS